MNLSFYRSVDQVLTAARLVQALLICTCLCLAPLSAACAKSSSPVTGANEPAAQPFLATSSINNPQVEASDLVRFPSPQVEFIVGPQLKAGSALNPVPWFDQTARDKGLEHGAAFPSEYPTHPLSGTVSVAKDSNIVVGTNTRFLRDFSGVAPYTYKVTIADSRGINREYVVAAISDDTHLTISIGWQQASSSGLRISKTSAEESDSYINLNYYDQALCQYINYYRTGDTRFLTYARKIADSWWGSPGIASGQAEIESSYAPRNVSLNGLILRALDGRPEMWPWITKYVREQFNTWVGLRVKYDGFYYGLRDPGYMLLFAANLAGVHSDATVRAEFKQKVLDAAVNLYSRLQSADGGFYFNLDSIDRTTQPFQVGILAEGLVAVHRLTNDERVKRTILKSAEHQFKRSYNARGWRGMYYFVGGTTKDTKESCEGGCGAAANRYPPSDKGQIAEVRQLNPTTIHHFGYAYLISGEVQYKTWGDEILDSTFGGQDGFRGLAAARAKEYDESYRSSGKYLAWRLAHGSGAAISARPAVVEKAPSPTKTTTPLEGSPRQLISEALQGALRLSDATASPSESQVQLLVDQIEAAQNSVSREPNIFLSPTSLLSELRAAAQHARAALLILTSPKGSGDDPKMRVGWAAARLKRAAGQMHPRSSP